MARIVKHLLVLVQITLSNGWRLKLHKFHVLVLLLLLVLASLGLRQDLMDLTLLDVILKHIIHFGIVLEVLTLESLY